MVRAKTTLEERTRQIVLYQDNYVGDTIDGIADEEWVKARSGFVVEMGDAAEYGSFERFRDIMLKAKVKESADGFYPTHSIPAVRTPPGNEMALLRGELPRAPG